MRVLRYAWVLIVVNIAVALAAEPSVGIYFRSSRDAAEENLGYEGIKLAMDESEYGESVNYVAALDAESLKGIGVLVLPSVYGFPKEWKEAELRASLRRFVADGGGIVVLNETMGWRRVFAGNPLFPEIGKGSGKGDAYMFTKHEGVGPAKIIYIGIKIDNKQHAVTKGVADFKALHDMPDIVPGDKGEVLARKTDQGAGAAVVVGSLGKGRVVLIAPALGSGERLMEQPPKGPALMLFLNAVKWAAGGK